MNLFLTLIVLKKSSFYFSDNNYKIIHSNRLEFTEARLFRSNFDEIYTFFLI